MRLTVMAVVLGLVSGACAPEGTVLVVDDDPPTAVALSETGYSVDRVDSGEVLDLILEPLRGESGLEFVSRYEATVIYRPECSIREEMLDTGWGKGGDRTLFAGTFAHYEDAEEFPVHPSISVHYSQFEASAEPRIPAPRPGDSCWLEPLDYSLPDSVAHHTEALGLKNVDEYLHVRYLEFHSGVVARITVPDGEADLLEELSTKLVAAHDANIDRVRLCHGDPDVLRIPNVYGPCEEAGVFGRGPDPGPRSTEPEVDVRTAPAE